MDDILFLDGAFNKEPLVVERFNTWADTFNTIYVLFEPKDPIGKY